MPGSIRKRADRCKNAYELRVFLAPDDYGSVRHKTKRLPRASRCMGVNVGGLCVCRVTTEGAR